MEGNIIIMTDDQIKNKLEIAKKLVRKAIELGDDELLSMANGIISECGKSNTNDSSTDDMLPIKQEKSKGTRKSKTKSKTTRKTDNSTNNDTTGKNKQLEESHIFTIYSNDSGPADSKEARLRPDGKLNCRKRKINVNIKHLDTGDGRNDPENKKLKKITPIVQSSRKNVNPFVKMTCEDCGKQKEISRALARENYICDKCIIRKTGA